MFTNAILIDGLILSHHLKHDLKEATARLLEFQGITPGLAIIRVGDDPSSEIYVEKKGIEAQKLGYHFEEFYFQRDAELSVILKCIENLNANPRIHGIIIQLPLPPHLPTNKLLSAIDPAKDVDGLHPLNAGKLAQGDDSGFTPCTPLACKLLLDTVHSTLAGKDVLVVGASLLVGRPLGLYLLQQGATVTVAHSLTKHLPDLCRVAEILIVAIGDPQFIQGDWIRPGATVIDVGINRKHDGTIVGDVDFERAQHVAGAITPVPGGVGPMTVACLLKNTLTAAERSIIIS